MSSLRLYFCHPQFPVVRIFGRRLKVPELPDYTEPFLFNDSDL